MSFRLTVTDMHDTQSNKKGPWTFSSSLTNCMVFHPFHYYYYYQNRCSNPTFYFACARKMSRFFMKFFPTFHSNGSSRFAVCQYKGHCWYRKIVHILWMRIERTPTACKHFMCCVFLNIFSFTVGCYHFHLFITCSDDSEKSDSQRLQSI